MRIAWERLVDIIAAMFVHAGGAPEEARAIALQLVTANLKGHDSHGVALVPRYIDSALDGRLKLGVRAQVVSDRGAFLLLDGGMGPGQVIGREAMEMGIAKAREHGIAVVGLRNVHHLGRIGAWAEICAGAGFISIHYVNGIGLPPIVAPFGGSDARFTTNPYCTAFPATEGPPIVLDMATSKIAMGKVLVAFNKGVPVPEGALIDSAGRPTTDPSVMFTEGERTPRGALLPFGLHKGYGLALVCELLAGALTGGGATEPEAFAENKIRNNMLTLIIDPAGFGIDYDLAAEIDRFVAWVKASPVAPDAVEGEVMVPGDPERKREAERGRDGIPLDPTTWQGLIAAGARVGMNRVEFEA